MEIDNFKVYDLQESLTAAGLPMKAEYCDIVQFLVGLKGEKNE